MYVTTGPRAHNLPRPLFQIVGATGMHDAQLVPVARCCHHTCNNIAVPHHVHPAAPDPYCCALRAGYGPGPWRVGLTGLPHRPGKCLESGLHDVMAGAPRPLVDVHRHPTGVDQGLEEVFHQLGVVGFDALSGDGQVGAEGSPERSSTTCTTASSSWAAGSREESGEQL